MRTRLTMLDATTIHSQREVLPQTREAKRFTLDGSNTLEDEVAVLCVNVGNSVLDIIGAGKIEGLVLGGGYGRGEGGVLRTRTGDRPYNDLEFYLFLSGNRFWNRRRYAPLLNAECDRLSEEAGLHVEIKIDSLTEWEQQPISMFSYDLVSGHQMVLGPDDLFERYGHHARGEDIPLEEATRLLFNRCSGLLLSLELLQNDKFGPPERIS